MSNRVASVKRPTILICNDDGYYAEGINRLKEALTPLGRIVLVAPSQDCSGESQKITLNAALRIHELKEDVYMINGTPVDCVHLALHGIFEGQPPDLLVSGINHGANLGEDTAYSGTVAAAYEGFQHQIPSIAISACRTSNSPLPIESAAKVAYQLVSAFLKGDPLLRQAIWNVNVPHGPIKGIKVTRLDKRSFKSSIIKRLDPRGKPYYWIGPYFPEFDNKEDTDYAAIKTGYVAMTPLKVEMTNFEVLDACGAGESPFSSISAHLTSEEP